LTFSVRPIGTIFTPWRELSACPRNGRQPDPPPECSAKIFTDFLPGLAGLEGFSHLILVYWMDRVADAPRLKFVPPFDTHERGVFSTRAPWRPNPIALSVVAFDGFSAPDTLRLRYLDCLDGTALLDIKPYLPTTDAVPDASMGWLAGHATRRKA
jgi:tRNA-Thr(GGU) m(6)t(6)A37 methyltransferase TsaA